MIEYKKTFEEIKSFLTTFDILCFQETKLSSSSSSSSSSSKSSSTFSVKNCAKQISSAELFNDIFPCKLYANSKSKPGYSGTAIFSKLAPVAVYEGFTGCLWSEHSKESLQIPCLMDHLEEKEETNERVKMLLDNLQSTLQTLDSEGRCIIADFGAFVLINAYFPNEDRDKKGFKMDFCHAMEAFCQLAVDQYGRKVMLVGDINAVPFFVDHADYAHKSVISKSDYEEFYHAEWRRWFKNVLSPEGLFVDTFRSLHPNDKEMYTCWNTLTSARDSNYGTRIDFILVDSKWFNDLDVISCDIHADVMGSDHCPVSISFKLEPTPHWHDFSGISKLSCFVGGGDSDPVKIPKKSITSYFVKANPALPSGSRKRITGKDKTLDSYFEKRPRINVAEANAEIITINDDEDDDEEEDDDDHVEDNLSSKDVPFDPSCELETLASSDPDSAIKAWKQLFSKEQKIPLCHGHKEPCKALRVNKKGINQGRLFFMCARPIGPESHPEKDQFRCKHFEWAKRKRKTLDSKQ